MPALSKEKQAEAAKKWYSKNRERILATRRERYKDNPNPRKQNNIDYAQKNREKYIHTQLRNRAKRRGIEFDLDVEDIVLPDLCPVLGVAMSLGTGSGKRSWHSYSVDRIDPSKGYVKGNIQIVCMRANVMKNDASVEELQQFAAWVWATYGA